MCGRGLVSGTSTALPRRSKEERENSWPISGLRYELGSARESSKSVDFSTVTLREAVYLEEHGQWCTKYNVQNKFHSCCNQQ
jgi:hypothetical protein